MIVWRGLGILVLPIVLVIWFVVVTAASKILPDISPESGHWISAVALVLSAVAVWFAGRKLNGKPGRELLDEKTGQRVLLKSTHSLFFINFEYWAIPLGLLAILSAII